MTGIYLNPTEREILRKKGAVETVERDPDKLLVLLRTSCREHDHTLKSLQKARAQRNVLREELALLKFAINEMIGKVKL